MNSRENSKALSNGMIKMSKAILDFKKLYDQFAKEKMFEQQFERYKTIDALKLELEEFIAEYECKVDHAILTLHLSDFVLTSSNIRDLSITDQQRRSSILSFCLTALEYGLETEPIILLHMLAQELGVAVRRNYAYQLDRGLPIDIALVRLADTFVVPFLQFIIGFRGLSLPWLVALTDSAISGILPDKSYQEFKDKDSLKKASEPQLLDAALICLERFEKVRTDKPNPLVTVPAVSESAGAVLIRSLKKNEEYFGCSKSFSEEKLQKIQKEFSKVCARSKFDKLAIETVYYRASSHSLTQKVSRQVFLVRGQETGADYEAWFFLDTPADDFNLSLIQKRLQNRSIGIEGIIRRPELPKKKVKKKDVKKAPKKQDEEQKTTVGAPKPKVSFWKKIKGLFRGKKEEQSVKTEPIPDAPKPIPESAEIKTEPVPVAKEPDITIEGWSRTKVLNLIAEVLVVDAVSGIDLEEPYDTLREKEYIISGLADFPTLDLAKPEGTLMALEEKRSNLKETITDLGPHLIELRDLAFQILPTSDQIQFIPQEVFAEHKGKKNLYELYNFATTEEALTILVAENSLTSNVAFIAPNKTFSKRRTLQMRTRQLVGPRTNVPFEDRVRNVLNELIDTSELKTEPISSPSFVKLLSKEDGS